jgi:hypothetical protein
METKSVTKREVWVEGGGDGAKSRLTADVEGVQDSNTQFRVGQSQ